MNTSKYALMLIACSSASCAHDARTIKFAECEIDVSNYKSASLQDGRTNYVGADGVFISYGSSLQFDSFPEALEDRASVTAVERFEQGGLELASYLRSGSELVPDTHLLLARSAENAFMFSGSLNDYRDLLLELRNCGIKMPQ